ncbi:hypothetical protein CYMTET_45970, partial [Cymbomonas tetramitiformis]
MADENGDPEKPNSARSGGSDPAEFQGVPPSSGADDPSVPPPSAKKVPVAEANELSPEKSGTQRGDILNVHDISNSFGSLAQIAPSVTINLQEFCSQALMPIKLHANALVSTNKELVSQSNRIDALTSHTFEKTDATALQLAEALEKMEKLEEKVLKADKGFEEMGNWKEEVLAVIYRDKQEREGEMKQYMDRLDAVESMVVEKTEVMEQRLENLEFDLASESAKRERSEEMVTKLKLTLEEKIRDTNNRMKEDQKITQDLEHSVSRLNERADESMKADDRLGVRITELEAREVVSEELMSLPDEVAIFKADFQILEGKHNLIVDRTGTLEEARDTAAQKLLAVQQESDAKMETMLQELRLSVSHAESMLKMLNEELESRTNTSIENLEARINGALGQGDEHTKHLKDLTDLARSRATYADVLELVRTYDPVLNQEKQDHEKAPRTFEEVIGILELQKELAAESADCPYTIAMIADRVKRNNTDILNLSQDLSMVIQKFDSGAVAQKDAKPAPTADLIALKYQVQNLEGDILQTAQLDAETKLNEYRKEMADEMEKFKVELAQVQATAELGSAGGTGDDSGGITYGQSAGLMEKLNKLTHEMMGKVGMPEMEKIKAELLESCQGMVKSGRAASINFSSKDKDAGVIKEMLEDNSDRLDVMTAKMVEMTSGMRHKADQNIVNVLLDDLANVRTELAGSGDRLRKEVDGLKADMLTRVTEPATREIVERMLRAVQATSHQINLNSLSAGNGGGGGGAGAGGVLFGGGGGGGLTEAQIKQIKDLEDSVKLMQQQVIAVDKGLMEQMDVKQEVNKLAGQQSRVNEIMVALRQDMKNKAPTRQVQALDALLREIARGLMGGDESQAVLAGKLGEIWKCLSCQKNPVRLTEGAGSAIPPQSWTYNNNHSDAAHNSFDRRDRRAGSPTRGGAASPPPRTPPNLHGGGRASPGPGVQ